jgi:hypothetical protein
MRSRTTFFAPDDTALFFLKTLLLSFWVGLDLIALLIAALSAESRFMHGGLVASVVCAILSCGTGCAIYMCLFVRPRAAGSTTDSTINIKKHLAASTVAPTVQKSRAFIVSGLIGASLLVTAPVVYSTLLKDGGESINHIDPDMAVITRKCAQIASLEQKLFQSNEKNVMADCLIEYGQRLS